MSDPVLLLDLHGLCILLLQLETQKTLRWKQPRKEKCELALEEGSEEDSSQFALLVDDEELELQELQTGPNPLTCCTHFTGNGLRGCSLCKGGVNIHSLMPFS